MSIEINLSITTGIMILIFIINNLIIHPLTQMDVNHLLLFHSTLYILMRNYLQDVLCWDQPYPSYHHPSKKSTQENLDRSTTHFIILHLFIKSVMIIIISSHVQPKGDSWSIITQKSKHHSTLPFIHTLFIFSKRNCLTLYILIAILLTFCFTLFFIILFASPLSEVEVVSISNVLGTQKELIFNLHVRAR